MMATSAKSKVVKATSKTTAKPAKKTTVPAKKPAPRKSAVTKPVAKKPVAKKPAAQATGQVLSELKLLAKELNQTAKDLGKRSASNPKEVSAILGNVERITAEAANKSLLEAESAKQMVGDALALLGKDWNRRQLDEILTGVSKHLTNIIVAQEFQDLAGQSLRKAMKALVGAIIVVESGGPTEDQRLSQKDVDSLLKDLMP
jgi:chemotaxis regulatin CheY-phosphate phosphatase CheZ